MPPSPERTPRTARAAGAQAASQDSESGITSIILSLFRNKAIREAAESIVIAFALAFLFRTFEAEAFVIPTGSMAPTLLGRHCDVECPQCHYRYRVSASLEVQRETEVPIGDVVAGTCPMCGYTACLNSRLGRMLDRQLRKQDRLLFNSVEGTTTFQDVSSRNGDRILVSKFAYQFAEPQRWNVFVFRYPGDASKNYIKRLVGLPNETLRIYRGDIFTAPYDGQAFDRPAKLSYQIERKPPDKVLAMMQMVYDNDFVLDSLTQKGWPTRWTSWPRPASETETAGAWKSGTGTRSFSNDGTAASVAWIRYQHLVPSFEDWQELLQPKKLSATERGTIKPQLITDSCAYNSGVGFVLADPQQDQPLFAAGLTSEVVSRMAPQIPDPTFLGLHWVRDLMLECELTVDKLAGEVVLELVAGGIPFHCSIDLATGKATLSVADHNPQHGFTAPADAENGKPAAVTRELSADTPVKAVGTYRLRFANADRELHLWVNNQLIRFPARATYEEFGNVIPRSNSETGLDLAPAGIGSVSAAVRVNHMRLYRDLYYIAAKRELPTAGPPIDFYAEALPESLARLYGLNAGLMKERFDSERAVFLSNPDLWPRAFGRMREVSFPLAKKSDWQKDQFLALGDNSPQSSDSRLWDVRLPESIGPPEADAPHTDREYYVERELLIGKALLTYWPLSHWGFVR